MTALSAAVRAWLEVRRENQHTHCCWCLHALDPLDALTTTDGRVVHPACLPAAEFQP